MDIKNILTDFGNCVFAGLTFIGFAIIYVGIAGRGRYNLVDDANWYFVGVGVVLILPFAHYMIKSHLVSKRLSEEDSERIKKLKKTGDKITVDLDELKIKTNSYKQEISVGSGYRQRNEYVDVNYNVILIKVPYRNEVIKYRLNIDMDPNKLRMHFAVKGKTELYVDSQNPNNNYLDFKLLGKLMERENIFKTYKYYSS